jgi:uncharacterized protein
VRHHTPAIPFDLRASPGSTWKLDAETGAVTVKATPHSDIFIDPGAGTRLNAESLLNAATLLGVPPQGDVQLSARVTVDFRATFDAGVLLIWVDDRHWAKLCFEYSPSGEPIVVSVVNRGVADDANAFVVEGRSVWLRVARLDGAFASTRRRTAGCGARCGSSPWTRPTGRRSSGSRRSPRPETGASCGLDLQRVVEPGEITVMVGSSAEDLALRCDQHPALADRPSVADEREGAPARRGRAAPSRTR